MMVRSLGLVGWSQGDVIPEIYDKIRYYFKVDRLDPRY
jgi:hypothetical protein